MALALSLEQNKNIVYYPKLQQRHPVRRVPEFHSNINDIKVHSVAPNGAPYCRRRSNSANQDEAREERLPTSPRRFSLQPRAA
jgi:hypothetical protein